MSDINFLSNDEKTKEEKGKSEKDGPRVEWTAPKKEDEKGKKKEVIKKQEKKNDEQKNQLDKKRIKESRAEVLSEIKKENKSKLGKGEGFSSGFSNWAKNIKEKLVDIFKKDEKKDKKGIVVDYQKVFDKEKEKRQNGEKIISTDLLKAKSNFSPEFKKEENFSVSSTPESGLSNSAIQFDGQAGKQVGQEKKEIKKEDPIQKKEHKKFFAEKFKFSRPRWESLNVIKTNLIQGEESAFFDWNKKIVVLVVNIVSACLFIAVIYGGLFFWEKQVNTQGEIILSDIENMKKNISGMEEDIDEIDNFQKNLSKVASILDQHLYWTNLFEFFEKNTLSEVYYTGGFSGDTSGEYDLSAVASEYSAIEGQLKVFRNAEEIISAESYQGSMSKKGVESEGGSRVSFDIALKIRPDIFLKKYGE